jgi:hypothetical protein
VSGFAGQAAEQIDRLVIAGHQMAAAVDKPEQLKRLTAQPALLNTLAIVLLTRSFTRDDLGRVVPYLSPVLLDALIENNVIEGVVRSEGDGQLALTDDGREFAEAVVMVQERAIAELWQGQEPIVRSVETIVVPLVLGARDFDPPTTPAAFDLFAGVIDRPAPEGRVLRAITAMRYWRADAHRATLRAAGLEAHEAHALNRLWDAQRNVERVGQGRVDPGERGVAALEKRGLAQRGAITDVGLDQREAIEADTDARTMPLYDALDAASRDRLLAGLVGLIGLPA